MDFSNEKIKIGAVVVLYHPNTQLLDTCIHSLAIQVSKLCIIDNTEGANVLLPKQEYNIEYIQLKRNIGIAAAQNIGINYFKKLCYDFVIFSDQDSKSPSGLVKDLLNAFSCLCTKYDISAIGPMPVNRKTGKPYIYNQYIVNKGNEESIEYYVMQSIISSYSLIPINNFKSVGLMNENLFIDFIDDDWCWRANYYHGKKSILIPNIYISHELGISRTFCGLQINVSSPFRIYYQVRNLIWLSRKEYVPFSWKKKNITKLASKIIYYSLIPSNRISYIKRMLNGLYDGLRLSLK